MGGGRYSPRRFESFPLRSYSSSILGFGASPPWCVRMMYRVRWIKASFSSASARFRCYVY
jgi:hypothetical protein